MVISSETIVSAVLKQLQKRFPKAKRYRDEQSQGISRPCFFVEQLNVSGDKQMLDRVKRGYRIRITYLAEDNLESLTKHLRSVGDALLNNFMRLYLSDTHLVYGRELEYEVVNGELLFTAEFPMHLTPKEEPKPQFKTLDNNITTN